jgi:hypothetical protein
VSPPDAGRAGGRRRSPVRSGSPVAGRTGRARSVRPTRCRGLTCARRQASSSAACACRRWARIWAASRRNGSGRAPVYAARSTVCLVPSSRWTADGSSRIGTCPPGLTTGSAATLPSMTSTASRSGPSRTLAVGRATTAASTGDSASSHTTGRPHGSPSTKTIVATGSPSVPAVINVPTRERASMVRESSARVGSAGPPHVHVCMSLSLGQLLGKPNLIAVSSIWAGREPDRDGLSDRDECSPSKG